MYILCYSLFAQVLSWTPSFFEASFFPRTFSSHTQSDRFAACCSSAVWKKCFVVTGSTSAGSTSNVCEACYFVAIAWSYAIPGPKFWTTSWCGCRLNQWLASKGNWTLFLAVWNSLPLFFTLDISLICFFLFQHRHYNANHHGYQSSCDDTTTRARTATVACTRGAYQGGSRIFYSFCVPSLILLPGTFFRLPPTNDPVVLTTEGMVLSFPPYWSLDLSLQRQRRWCAPNAERRPVPATNSSAFKN